MILHHTRFHFIKILFACLMMLTAITHAASSQFTARIDQPKISMNEHVQLFLHFKGNPPSRRPNLAPLNKNFIIVAVGQSKQTEITNGKISQNVEITLNLAPKKHGKLIIPSIRWGTYKTHPIALQVNKTKPLNTSNTLNMKSATGTPHVFIEETLSNPHPYTHAQTIYTLKIYSDINIFKSDLDVQGVDSFLWADLGTQIDNNVMYKGHRYQLQTRRFALFPEKVGQHDIGPAHFRGLARMQGSYTLTPVYANGKSHTIDVKPKPASVANQWWLPANNVTLKERWSGEVEHPKVGAPITRTVTLAAIGSMSAQLPKFTIDKIQGIKVYPEKADVRETVRDYYGEPTLIATNTQKIVYMPNEGGSITIPSLKVHWWNTKTDTAEVATLPEKTFVLPITKVKKQTKGAADTIDKNLVPLHSKWLLLLLSGVAIGLLVMLILYRRMQHRLKKITARANILNQNTADPLTTATASTQHANPALQQNEIKATLSAIKRACGKHNATEVVAHLLAWAKQQFPDKPFTHANEVIEYFNDDELTLAYANLDKACYSPQQNTWDGNAFWLAFKNAYKTHRSSASDNEKDALPDLYL